MSINVTVSGNPVSIKRGKMVTTTDPQAAKKEFDKRRLLRLEQVRQQSKELAENVRTKVQKEKKRQLGQIEKDGMYFKCSVDNKVVLYILFYNANTRNIYYCLTAHLWFFGIVLMICSFLFIL